MLERDHSPAPTRSFRRAGRRLGRWVATAVALFAGPIAAQEVVSASPDITIATGGVVAEDGDVVVDNQLGVVLLENLGAVPAASDVVALGAELDGDRLVAFDTTTLLAGGVVARRGDVVRTDGSTYALVFDASVAGVPTAAATDAVSLAPGGLLLSFDTTVALPGSVVAADEDLVVWDGASFTLVFDGSAEGVEPALDVDGAQALGAGAYLLSFDTSGVVGGVTFSDEDLVRFDGTGFTLELDMTSLDASWGAADVDALFVPEPGFGWALAFGAAGLAGAGARRRRRWLYSTGIALAALAMASGADAAEGQLEINQTCAVQTGCFTGDDPGLPVTINRPGSYRLTSNLVTPDSDTGGIRVNVRNVGLDLGGFTIVRSDCVGDPGTCTIAAGAVGSYGVFGANLGLHVHNGSVVGMGTDGVFVATDSIVEGVRSQSNAGRGISTGSHSIVRNCIAADNLDEGIQTLQAARVLSNRAHGNGREGIETGAASSISGNLSFLNGGVGITADFGSTVVENNTYDNGAFGILTFDGSTVIRNTIRGNTLRGLSLQPGGGYRENVLSDNAGGTVFGGVNLFSNLCDGSTTCP